MRRCLVVFALACVSWIALEAQAPATTPIKAIRLFSGTDGETHAEEITLTGIRADGPQADLLKPGSIRYATRGADTWDDWHTAPGRQYLITLKGHVEIEIGGGKKVEAGPGSVLPAGSRSPAPSAAPSMNQTSAAVLIENGESLMTRSRQV